MVMYLWSSVPWHLHIAQYSNRYVTDVNASSSNRDVPVFACPAASAHSTVYRYFTDFNASSSKGDEPAVTCPVAPKHSTVIVTTVIVTPVA